MVFVTHVVPFFDKSHFLIPVACETRVLARLESSRMVSWEKFAEVVGTRRVSGERHVLYLTSYVRTSTSGLECLARPGLRDETGDESHTTYVGTKIVP